MSQKMIPGLNSLSINTIFCIGRNYAEHALEMKADLPEQPLVFLKPASSIIYNGQEILLPSQSKEIHHEVELVVALSRGGKNIDPSEAERCIAGYGVGIDITARDIQQKAKEKGHPWSVAKGFDTFAPISNFVPAETLEDPQDLELELRVNGNLRQKGNTRDMIFSVNELIAYLSGIFTLSAGDLIFTGTPSGVSPLTVNDIVKADLNNGLCSLELPVKSCSKP